MGDGIGVAFPDKGKPRVTEGRKAPELIELAELPKERLNVISHRPNPLIDDARTKALRCLGNGRSRRGGAWLRARCNGTG